MTISDDEMRKALAADGEKLKATTGEDHGPYFFDEDILEDCWNCGGEGYVSDCIDGCCVDAESGCDMCTYRCDVCNSIGKAAGV